MLKYLLVLVLLGISCRGEKEPDPEQRIAEIHVTAEDFQAERNDFTKLLEDMLSFFWDERKQLDEAANREEVPEDCPPEIPNATCDQHKAEPPGGCCVDYGNICHLKHGGQCFEEWKKYNPLCDMKDYDICGKNRSCYCCIDCDARNSSLCAHSGGKCMKECGLTMRLANGTSCHSDRCSCCVACRPYKCEGTCLGKAENCKSGYKIEENKCLDRDCVCCVPCSVTRKCLEEKGYPERSTIKCKEGYEANAAEADPGCVCCQPKNQEDKCKVQAINDIEMHTSFCSDTACPPNYLQTTGGCESPNKPCSHCAPSFRKCIHREGCEALGGYCTRKGCRDGFYNETEPGTLCSSADERTCHCCIPGCHKNSGGY